MRGQTVAFWIVAVLIGAAAFAFGSVETWAEEWLRLGALVAFVLVVFKDSPKTLLRGRAGAVLLPALLLVLWGLLQSVPLPRVLTRTLSPHTAAMQAATTPEGGGAELRSFLLKQAPARGVTIEGAATLPAGPPDPGSRAARSSLSINPYATRRACLAWLTPLLLFVVAERLARDPLRRYRLLWAAAIWTGALGAVAVVQRVAWNGKILWLRETPKDSGPLGPFVNPNHFAGFTELGLLVTAGLVLAILGGADGRLGLQSIRSALTDRGWGFPRLLVLGAIAMLGAAGIFLSGSRGGQLALLAGLVMLAPLGRLRAWIPAASVVVVVLALGLGLASWVGPEEQTLQTGFFAAGTGDLSLAMRSDIWGRTWRVLADHPLTGTGLGTFEWAYSSYDREGEWQGTIQAHNDYLQLASESGLVGIALLAWLVIAVARKALGPAFRPPAGRPRFTTLALASAVVVMLLHSVIEFNLQIPAVAALFAVLGGALVAAGADPIVDGERSVAS